MKLPSLKLKCGIKLQDARDVIRKAEKNLIRGRIRLINKLGLQDWITGSERRDNMRSMNSCQATCVLAFDESSRERIRNFKMVTCRQIEETNSDKSE